MIEVEPSKSRPLKRILLGDSPYLCIGGGELSKDIKFIFIDKVSGKHYTLRLINDLEQGKVTVDFHSTDESINKLTGKAQTPIFKIICDLKGIERDNEKLEKAVKSLLLSKIQSVKSEEIFKGKTIVPVISGERISEIKKSGKEVRINDKKLTEFIKGTKGPADLEKFDINKGIIRENGKTTGVVFVRDGVWNYLDLIDFMRAIITLFEPYIITTEGVSKDEFLSKTNSL